MFRTIRCLAAAAAVAVAPVAAGAASGIPPQLRELQFLVGTWECAHTVGTFSGRYRETFEPALGGRWIRQTYAFPATAEEPATQASYVIEYDERVPRWVRFGAHSNGQYYGMYALPGARGTWNWTYVLPNRK